MTETVRSKWSEIQRCFTRPAEELLESDEVILGAPAQFKEKLKLAPSLVSITAKEQENMWNCSLGYKKDIKNWNTYGQGISKWCNRPNSLASLEATVYLWRKILARQKMKCHIISIHQLFGLLTCH